MTPELPLRFEPNTAVQLVSPIVLLLQTALLWVTVRPRDGRAEINFWALGSVMSALGLALVALRDLAPDIASYTLANLLVVGAYLARATALQHFLGRPPSAQRVTALTVGLLLFGLAYHALFLWGSARLRVSFALVFWTAGASVMAWWSWQVARATWSRSAKLTAAVEAGMTMVLALYCLTMASGRVPAVAMPNVWQGLALAYALGASAIYGNLGYLGLLLDRLQKRQVAARESEQRQIILRELAEKDAVELRAALQQRDALSAERETLLRVLTHEIRQPLHNAGGALQSIRLSTQAGPGLNAAQLRERVLRAEQVLGRMRDVLDNVLNAALLLQQPALLSARDTDLETLLQLTLLDLSEAERARVQLDWRSVVHSAAVEPNLLRLAVRNLLRNALQHGGASAQVRLCVEDGYSPQRLRITVLDDGPGMLPLALQAHNQAGGQAAAPGSAEAAINLAVRADGSGLGLQIVRRVAALHGGTVHLHNLAHSGLAVVLELPAPDDWVADAWDAADAAPFSPDAAASHPSSGAAWSPPSAGAPSP